MSKVTQAKFVEQLARECGITASEGKKFLDGFKTLIYQTLASGNTVELSGFGQFSVSHRAARLGVNPRTMAKITIPEFNTPKFRSGEAFKQAVALK